MNELFELSFPELWLSQSAFYSPAFVFFLGALMSAFTPARLSAFLLCLTPLVSLGLLLLTGSGPTPSFSLLDFEISLFFLDRLNLPFVIVFHLGAFLAALYGAGAANRLERGALLVYAGASIGAVSAGDVLSLFFFLECATIASTLLIWAGSRDGAPAAGLHYIFIHLLAGLCLLFAALLAAPDTQSLMSGPLSLNSITGVLIFTAIAIKAGLLLVHSWIQDGYPKASATGTLALSLFTTKIGIYLMARSFAGLDLLIPLGLCMALVFVLMAALENDLRKALTYGLSAGVGFMLAGIGVGTPLALQGVIAFAIASILYEALIFMSLGAVVHRTGTARASDLGGLFHSMPLSGIFCMIGCAGLSSVPLLVGFVGKGALFEAFSAGGHQFIWLALLFAATAKFVALGIRIPLLVFFGANGYERTHATQVHDAPSSMIAAMSLCALLCVLLGVMPQLLYAVLPQAGDIHAYTPAHVFTQIQILAFGALAFVFLYRRNVIPPPLPFTLVETDAIYRKLIPAAFLWLGARAQGLENAIARLLGHMHGAILRALRTHLHPGGRLALHIDTGTQVIWILVVLIALIGGAVATQSLR